MEIDFFAPLRLTQLVLPHMIARRSGRIAIISSVAGKLGVPLRTGYCAAKHACVGYFEALRAEVETAYGVGVTVILPGSVKTSIAANALNEKGESRGRSDPNIDNGIPAEKAAGLILDGLAAGAREIVVAEGRELAGLQMRATNPELVFAATASEGARLAALRGQAGSEFSPEPGRVNG
jgi:dehydrogenase/reductase SDR family protein 7B